MMHALYIHPATVVHSSPPFPYTRRVSRIRLGIIGAGLAVRELHLPVLAAMRERFDVVALASRSVESARRLAAELNTTVGRAPTVFATHDELLQSGLCEAVAVAVPIALTPTIVRSALAVGCHVLAEKPLADTVAEHRALIALARSKGVTLMVGEQIRYRRPFHQCHELVTAGLIGRPCVYRLNDMHWTSPEGKYAMTSWRREGRHRGEPGFAEEWSDFHAAVTTGRTPWALRKRRSSIWR